MGRFYRLSNKSRSLSLILGGVFLLGGIFLLIYALFGNRNTPVIGYAPSTFSAPLKRESLPNFIHIMGFIDLPVEEMQFSSTGWQVSDTAASIASTSARPGETGNIVMYSHNTRNLFGKLSRVKKGDVITLTTQDGKEHGYAVTDRVIVNPDEIDLLRPTQVEVLTLYTCSGFLDSKRLVVQAKPL